MPATGIVVVSHSRALADAAVALALEVGGGRARIEVAAGLDPSTFGTDATAIAAALEAADDGAGVVVLMDLGSAVLSSELALELVDPDLAGRVTLSPAPLVEGLVVAAVSASGGADRDTVAAEVARALAAKEEHLGAPAAPAEAPTGSPEPPSADGPAVEGEFVVTDPVGLHARPAGRLVAEATAYDATVLLSNLDTGAGPVAADSMLAVMTLGVEGGHRVAVRATGPQATEAVAGIIALVEAGFPAPS